MSENKLREKPAEVPQKPKPPSRRTRKLIRFLNGFGIVNRNQIVHAMPFIAFVAVLIFGYITNSYYAEKVVRELDKTKSDLKEKRAEFISTKSELMHQSRQSEVARTLTPTEIKESTEPPQKIILEKKNKK